MSLREDTSHREDAIVETNDESLSPTTADTPRVPAVTPPAMPVPGPSEPAGAAPKRRRPLKKLLLLTVLAAALGGGGYAGWQYWTLGRFFVSTDDAYVQADISVLAAKVPGYLEAVPVVNGQSVRKGDVIARLDDGDYRLALRASQDKLATQESTIARIARQAEAAQAQVVQSAAQVEGMKADAVRAAADYVRATQMQADYVAKSKLDQTKADRDRTDASVKGAQAAVIAAKANVDVLNAQKQEAESLAGELRTAVDRAQRDLDFTMIRAPFDGVVGNKAVEAGAYVQPGSRIVALVPLQSVRIDANFKETQVSHMKPGQPVSIIVDAYPDKAIQGEVESFSPASGTVFSLLPTDNATGNFTKIVQRLPVRVHVPADVAREGLLRPGMSVTVRVDTRGPDERAPVRTAHAIGE
ncbi:HlyD family secretion protein [Methylobacterium haplocladii]|uniref:Hemolysin D n=1 Tax=Methylobacterium haplocladii TaxID=1176176 RepID=A0A512INU2_9HYPH|nr:HlyD family secretion protein [Methylobacterium haplocladii]GEO99381.1 hemolysin D [Methylobacterium haplocladii]GJD83415.1 Colistin resistance protein EmrA [Methylobacterium haplocladii]GLS60271.1 hemolysin D [Methylobacterium haplocladii]